MLYINIGPLRVKIRTKICIHFLRASRGQLARKLPSMTHAANSEGWAARVWWNSLTCDRLISMWRLMAPEVEDFPLIHAYHGRLNIVPNDDTKNKRSSSAGTRGQQSYISNFVLGKGSCEFRSASRTSNKTDGMSKSLGCSLSPTLNGGALAAREVRLDVAFEDFGVYVAHNSNNVPCQILRAIVL